MTCSSIHDEQSTEIGSVLSAYPDGTLKEITTHTDMNVAQLFMNVCQEMCLIPSNYAYQVYSSKFPPSESIICIGSDKVRSLNIRYIRLIPRIFINEGYNSLFAFHSNQNTSKAFISIINKLTGVSISLNIDLDMTVEQLTLKACRIFNLKPPEDYELVHPIKSRGITLALHYPFMVYGLDHVIVNWSKVKRKCNKMYRKVIPKKTKVNKIVNYDNTVCENNAIDNSKNYSSTNGKSFSVNLSSRQDISKLSSLLPSKKKKAPSPPDQTYDTDRSNATRNDSLDSELNNLSDNKIALIAKDFDQIKSQLGKCGGSVTYDEYTYIPVSNKTREKLTGISEESVETIPVSAVNIEADTCPRYSTSLPRGSVLVFTENSTNGAFGSVSVDSNSQHELMKLKEYRKRHVADSISSHTSNQMIQFESHESPSFDEACNPVNSAEKSTSSNDESIAHEKSEMFVKQVDEAVVCSAPLKISHESAVDETQAKQLPQMAKTVNLLRTTLKFLMPKPYHTISS